jgi:cyclopropane fatty-acyl-phospholipid synthase-like methyltransferase
MSLVSNGYLDQLKELHVQRADFGKGGNMWAHAVMRLCALLETEDVLDYGCGKGELNLHMPYEIKCYDPAVHKYRHEPNPADIVVSTDVLEHIEPDFLSDVLFDLKRCVKKLGLFAIHTGPALKYLPDGRNAHLIQEEPEWWDQKLAELFKIRDKETMGSTHVVTVEPKA